MKLRRIILRASVGIVGSFCVFGAATAATPSKSTTTSNSTSSSSSSSDTASTASNAASVQGYSSDTSLQVGTIVSLMGTGAAKVAPSQQKNLDQMYGVVVDPHDLSLTLSAANLQNEAYVATNGTYNVLVTNQTGVIKVGDYVTLSAVDGVAMKATTDQSIVFGRAAGSFDGKNNTLGTIGLKDTSGTSAGTYAIGSIPVAIDIRHNPNEKSTKAEVPQWLQRVGQAIADKPVGPVRIYLSMGITAVSLIAAIVMLGNGVRSSLIAIGRNPLSKKTIFRGLIEVILTAFIVLIIGLFAVYLLLKL